MQPSQYRRAAQIILVALVVVVLVGLLTACKIERAPFAWTGVTEPVECAWSENRVQGPEMGTCIGTKVYSCIKNDRARTVICAPVQHILLPPEAPPRD